MRPSLLLALGFFSAPVAFFSAQIDHAQAANGGKQQVAQATSRTGGYDLYPGGGSPGGLAIPGAAIPGGMPTRRYAPAVGGAYPGGVNPGGAYTGGMYPGGTYPSGTYSGGEFPTGGASALPGGHPRDATR